VTFACRYLSNDPGKNLTPDEVTALRAAGISIVANWESTATRAEEGYQAGVQDATVALSQANNCGMPEGRPIYFSVDEDTTVGPNITAYFQGVASVLGLSRTGGYGGYRVISGLLNVGLISWAWQTYAWSGWPTQWDVRANIRQVQNNVALGGVFVDYNHAMTTDYGQWDYSGDEFVMDAEAKARFDKLDAAVASGFAFALSANGARFDQLSKALTNIYGPQKRDANGNLVPVDPTHTGIGDLDKKLGGVTTVVQEMANVVHNLPATSGSVDTAPILAAIEQLQADLKNLTLKVAE
jgi:hypothetical protein